MVAPEVMTVVQPVQVGQRIAQVEPNAGMPGRARRRLRHEPFAREQTAEDDQGRRVVVDNEDAA